MARYIRIYKSPTETPGNILGFSSGISGATYDEVLHNWLRARGYDVTSESEEQRNALINVGSTAIRTQAYDDAPGIPIPEGSVSATHLQIEPPLKNEHLRPLGTLLSKLTAIDDGGQRRHFLVDNRDEPPDPHDATAGTTIAQWG